MTGYSMRDQKLFVDEVGPAILFNGPTAHRRASEEPEDARCWAPRKNRVLRVHTARRGHTEPLGLQAFFEIREVPSRSEIAAREGSLSMYMKGPGEHAPAIGSYFPSLGPAESPTDEHGNLLRL